MAKEFYKNAKVANFRQIWLSFIQRAFVQI